MVELKLKQLMLAVNVDRRGYILLLQFLFYNNEKTKVHTKTPKENEWHKNKEISNNSQRKSKHLTITKLRLSSLSMPLYSIYFGK